MDTIQNLRAFLAVADTGSFSAAARRAGLATSVLTKRVDQLEHAAKVRLFDRTTRAVIPTEAARRWIDRVRYLVADVDDVMRQATAAADELEGPIRVKAPTTLTALHLGSILTGFQGRHPKVSLDLVLTDRIVNPAEERFDIAIAAFNATFGSVVDVPLCPLKRRLCASPGYLRRRGVPRHPRDLLQHDVISFAPTGSIWSFTSPSGPTTVEITPHFTANDGQVLLRAAREGNGIALLSDYLVAPLIDAGELRVVLPEHVPPEIWLKMLVPENRRQISRVQALVDTIRRAFADRPPWTSLCLTHARPE